jgi:hypothetical protein
VILKIALTGTYRNTPLATAKTLAQVIHWAGHTKLRTWRNGTWCGFVSFPPEEYIARFECSS